MPRFISIPEAGLRLGRSPRSVRRLIETGRLTAISIPGTHTRVALSSVDELIPAVLRLADDLKPRARPRGRPFQPGQSGNPQGRPVAATVR